jgi:hypothetical protein
MVMGFPRRQGLAAVSLMTYFVSLKLVAIIIGLLYVALHLPSALAPERIGVLMRKLPRNYPLGIGLMLAATLWFAILTGTMDLGELSGMRATLVIVWTVAGVLVAIFVPGFLTARGLGSLLLLAAAVILDAGFLVQTPARYVLTILAYIWVIKGMVLVYSPHVLRDWIDFATRTPQRLRLLSWPGVIFGVVLMALGFFVYP